MAIIPRSKATSHRIFSDKCSVTLANVGNAGEIRARSVTLHLRDRISEIKLRVHFLKMFACGKLRGRISSQPGSFVVERCNERARYNLELFSPVNWHFPPRVTGSYLIDHFQVSGEGRVDGHWHFFAKLMFLYINCSCLSDQTLLLQAGFRIFDTSSN